MKRWIHSATAIEDGDTLADKIAKSIQSEIGDVVDDCYFEEDYNDGQDAVILYTTGDYKNVCDYAHDYIVDNFKPNDSEWHEVDNGDSTGSDNCTVSHIFLWDK